MLNNYLKYTGKARIRSFPESNYLANFDYVNRECNRFFINENCKKSYLKYPELYDISPTTKCFGNCPYCYTSAIHGGKHHKNCVAKLLDLFEPMSLNERPFQVAFGGQGEAVLHPDFCEMLEVTAKLGILPNYTTSGVGLTDKVIEATLEYCGGVAVSLHPHLKKAWCKTIKRFREAKVYTSVHVILGSPGSLDYFWECYNKLDDIESFVVLPYQAAGRAQSICVEQEWINFFKDLEILEFPENIVVGALFNPFLKRSGYSKYFSTYDETRYSGYIILDESYKKIRLSSYDLEERLLNV